LIPSAFTPESIRDKSYKILAYYINHIGITSSWTIVHPLNESSPLFQFSQADFEKSTGEIIVFIKAFDDKYSNTVVSRTSYTFNELKYGYKFLPMFHSDPKEAITILDLSKIDASEKVDLPELVTA
jgi:inward rectifier potassium channel